ncbi:ATP-binding protein [Pseudothermotoga sp.]
MFFSLEPKAGRKNLYDREKELEQLEKFLGHGRIAVVTGVRRIGKTSIVRTFLNDRRKTRFSTPSSTVERSYCRAMLSTKRRSTEF